MKRTDLTDKVLSDPTIEFEYFGRFLDLHNDFSCIRIFCEPVSRVIKFYFLNDSEYYSISFENSEYHYVDFEGFGLAGENGLCLDGFSKLEWKEINGSWVEFNNTGQYKHFEINFIEGLCFIIKAEKCFLVNEDIKLLRDEQDFEKRKVDLRTERKGLKEKYKQLEIDRQTGQIDSKAFIFEKQKIRKRMTEIRNIFGTDDLFGEDFKI